jgi:hypothetical protein
VHALLCMHFCACTFVHACFLCGHVFALVERLWNIRHPATELRTGVDEVDVCKIQHRATGCSPLLRLRSRTVLEEFSRSATHPIRLRTMLERQNRRATPPSPPLNVGGNGAVLDGWDPEPGWPYAAELSRSLLALIAHFSNIELGGEGVVISAAV